MWTSLGLWLPCRRQGWGLRWMQHSGMGAAPSSGGVPWGLCRADRILPPFAVSSGLTAVRAVQNQSAMSHSGAGDGWCQGNAGKHQNTEPRSTER